MLGLGAHRQHRRIISWMFGIFFVCSRQLWERTAPLVSGRVHYGFPRVLMYPEHYVFCFVPRSRRKGVNATLTLAWPILLCRGLLGRKGVNATLTLARAVLCLGFCLAERGSTRRSLLHGLCFFVRFVLRNGGQRDAQSGMDICSA